MRQGQPGEGVFFEDNANTVHFINGGESLGDNTGYSNLSYRLIDGSNVEPMFSKMGVVYKLAGVERFSQAYVFCDLEGNILVKIPVQHYLNTR